MRRLPPERTAGTLAAVRGGSSVDTTMGFTPLVPTTVPLLMGTEELADDVLAGFEGR